MLVRCLVYRVLDHVGRVTNSASRGIQNEIVASAENLGRVGGKFVCVSEKFWTRQWEVWKRQQQVLDTSAGSFGRVSGKFWMRRWEVLDVSVGSLYTGLCGPLVNISLSTFSQ